MSHDTYKLFKNPREERFGKTPLHNAAANGHVEICKLITENVVEKNPKDKYGSSPFHSAVTMGKSEVFMFLMEKIGDQYVDQQSKCIGNVTPLQIAEAVFPPDVMNQVKNKYFTLKRGRFISILRHGPQKTTYSYKISPT